jgi:hypothetical protein
MLTSLRNSPIFKSVCWIYKLRLQPKKDSGKPVGSGPDGGWRRLMPPPSRLPAQSRCRLQHGRLWPRRRWHPPRTQVQAAAFVGVRPPSRVGRRLDSWCPCGSWAPDADSLAAGSSLSATMNASLIRSEIGRSWRLLSAALVSQACIVDFHMVFPEMNPLMSGDPSALLEKLIIDAVLILCVRNIEDSKAYNWEVTPASLACRSNVKYHVFCGKPREFPAAGPLADMKKRIKHNVSFLSPSFATFVAVLLPSFPSNSTELQPDAALQLSALLILGFHKKNLF